MLNSFIKKMFCISCPQCNKSISLLAPRRFEQWRYGLVHCKQCGSNLKASNALFLASLYGLFCGAMITSSNCWKFGTEWLRFAIVIAVCWFIVFPLLNRLIGRWQVVTNLSHIKSPPPTVRKWHRYANLSFWLSIVALLSSSVIVWFCMKQMTHDFSLLDQVAEQSKNQLLDDAERWPKIMASAMFVSIALTAVFFIIGIVCHAKGKKAASILTT
jgi:hypothetical protein